MKAKGRDPFGPHRQSIAIYTGRLAPLRLKIETATQKLNLDETLGPTRGGNGDDSDELLLWSDASQLACSKTKNSKDGNYGSDTLLQKRDCVSRQNNGAR